MFVEESADEDEYDPWAYDVAIQDNDVVLWKSAIESEWYTMDLFDV